ncbi:hypothetical protein ACR9YC_02175 [Parasphingorhabdus sp. DH2-15]|uniref:hypothetical protein n=1 Tax=Parasphingorhabdus sp. DH2-15 TaxID=3444112 RepID=UPI003F6878BB
MRRPGSQKVVETFADACGSGVLIRPARHRGKGKPFSIRLSDEDRAQLEREAGPLSLGPYIRFKLLGTKPVGKKLCRPKANQKELAQILAWLGQSDIAPSLRELSKAARLGALPESPEAIAAINNACSTIDGIHAALIRALGLRS